MELMMWMSGFLIGCCAGAAAMAWLLSVVE